MVSVTFCLLDNLQSSQPFALIFILSWILYFHKTLFLTTPLGMFNIVFIHTVFNLFS